MPPDPPSLFTLNIFGKFSTQDADLEGSFQISGKQYGDTGVPKIIACETRLLLLSYTHDICICESQTA